MKKIKSVLFFILLLIPVSVFAAGVFNFSNGFERAVEHIKKGNYQQAFCGNRDASCNLCRISVHNASGVYIAFVEGYNTELIVDTEQYIVDKKTGAYRYKIYKVPNGQIYDKTEFTRLTSYSGTHFIEGGCVRDTKNFNQDTCYSTCYNNY